MSKETSTDYRRQSITAGDMEIQSITIQDIRTTIHFYALRSEFAQKTGLSMKPFTFATDGIKLASRNNQVNQLFKPMDNLRKYLHDVWGVEPIRIVLSDGDSKKK